MARKWETIICYEDRADHLTTSRWRLDGIKTKEGSENTDSGVLWLKTAKSGDDLTAEVYKDDACDSGDKVASSAATDISPLDNTAANAVEIALSEANSSGLSGSFWIHNYEDDGTCPVQAALCADEDLDALWDDIEALPGYDPTNGCAEFIRLASEDMIGSVTAIFREQLGGYGASEAWYITDAQRTYPDLRRIANPGQLRLACAYRALSISLGRSHQRAGETMYSELRDYFGEQFRSAMASLQLAFKGGSASNAVMGGNTTSHHLDRA